MTIVGIKFKSDGKSYNFLTEDNLTINEKVVVETEKGLQLGVVSDINVNSEITDIKKVIRKASEEDYNKYLKNLSESENALIFTRDLIEKYKLNMHLIDATFSLDKKVLFFNFISEERVDFRELVKELAGKYHTRIELHQVGVRDKAKTIGGIGLCGRELCCKNHLSNVGSVNINMVKNQNLALNPTKINGACGRLLCCFTYENCTYEQGRKLLPSIGEHLNYNGKDAIVTELDILKEKYTIQYTDGTTEELTSESNK